MVLMGCSGSTGSSLLRTILNRHPRILSGAELYFFCYPQLYLAWNRYKDKLLDTGFFALKTDGVHLSKGTKLLNPDYLWDLGALKQLIKKSNSINEFVAEFYAPALDKQSASLVVEKTPANAYCFSPFIKQFPESKLLHITRNPYDTLASLYQRSFSPYMAAATYLYNTVAAESLHHNPVFYRIRYEDLVLSPQHTVKELCHFFELDFMPQMLIAQSEKQNEITKMEGWNFAQNESIQAGSIGRFQLLSEEIQEQLINAFGQISISAKHILEKDFKFKNAQEICEHLNYEYHQPVKAISTQLKLQQQKDIIFRMVRLYPTGFSNYPIEKLK